jgi:hypothetical protein
MVSSRNVAWLHQVYGDWAGLQPSDIVINLDDLPAAEDVTETDLHTTGSTRTTNLYISAPSTTTGTETTSITSTDIPPSTYLPTPTSPTKTTASLHYHQQSD